MVLTLYENFFFTLVDLFMNFVFEAPLIVFMHLYFFNSGMYLYTLYPEAYLIFFQDSLIPLLAVDALNLFGTSMYVFPFTVAFGPVTILVFVTVFAFCFTDLVPADGSAELLSPDSTGAGVSTFTFLNALTEKLYDTPGTTLAVYSE